MKFITITFAVFAGVFLITQTVGRDEVTAVTDYVNIAVFLALLTCAAMLIAWRARKMDDLSKR